jgi:hypothetical protein
MAPDGGTAGGDAAPGADAPDTAGSDAPVSSSDGLPLASDAGPIEPPASTCTPGAGCDGGTCWLHPSGAHACVPGITLRTPCMGEAPSEICCGRDSECTRLPGGRCIDNVYQPRCGGGAPARPGSHCSYDQCAVDADCKAGAHGTCLPPGLGYPNRHCAYGPCRTSSDCTAGPGGVCDVRPSNCGPAVLFCRYATDPCRVDRECPNTAGHPYGETCVPRPDGQGTHCVPLPPPGA